METLLHAQPYDISANGFYFKSAEEYEAKARDLKNDFGDPVEEFEIQFIDGDDPDLLDVDVYEEDNFKDLAIRFVDEAIA